MDTRTSRHSFGLLVFRRTGGAASIEGGSFGGVEVLIAHPGGPLWARKDEGAWSVPKGLPEADESPLDTARREFAEEIGHAAPRGEVIELGDVRQKSGKVVTAFAVEGDVDVDTVVSNTFEMVWPPRSGCMQTFPEVDRAQWCGLDEARVKLNPAQAEFVDRLESALGKQ
ncbi:MULTISPECIES: NUDIX domain-containing protein [Gordonia]|uniref:NUDIX domain-containing protein n=1 Tax=Gordonia TaxID=2053 RepID=UPI000A791A70|nr:MULTISPECIES: NUDIX domain-containing protein [Gordonia]